MSVRIGLMVVVLAVGCSKAAEREASVRQVASDAAVDEVAALEASIDQRAAGDDIGAAEDAGKLVALLRARKSTGDASYASALERYGQALFSIGRWADAETVLVEALALPRSKSDLVLRASVLYQLGGVYGEQRRNDEAIIAVRESLELSEQVHGPESEETSNSLELLSSVYDYAGRYAEAETLCRRALKLTEARHSAASPQVGRVLVNLALNLDFQERNREAVALYRRAIKLLEATTGYERNSLAQAHSGIAAILHRGEELRAAEKSYRLALAVRREALGPDHPLMAMDYYNLAVVLEDQHTLEPAVEACSKSEGLRRKMLAPDHPHRIETENLCKRLRGAVELLRKPPKQRVDRARQR